MGLKSGGSKLGRGGSLNRGSSDGGSITPPVTGPSYPQFGIAPTRSGANPIIPLAGASAWYVSQIYDFAVLVNPGDATQLLMFCTGMAAPVFSGVQSIGVFTAPVADPTDWTEVGQILQPTEVWENGQIRNGSVVWDGTTMHIFYTGNISTSSIGVATATTDFTNPASWTKYASNPILTPDGQGRDDGSSVSEPAVLKDGGTWTMIYSYRDGTTILPGFKVATSTDGLSWTKAGAGHVLPTAPLYGEFHHLRKTGTYYYLIYEAGNASTPFRIFVASSTTAHGPFFNIAGNPFLSESGTPAAFDRYHVATPALLAINDDWYLFYCGAVDFDQPYAENHWPGGLATLTTGATETAPNSPTPPSGLVGQWKLNDGSGTTAVDSVNGNNGTLVNTPTWITGPYSGALSFNSGSDEYVDLGDPAALRLTSDMSVSGWVNMTSPEGMLIAKDGDTGGRAYTFDLQSAKPRFYINGGGGGALIESDAAIATGDWHFVAGTYDHAAAGGTLKIYVDGALHGTATGVGSSIPTATANVMIGRRAYSGFETPLNGKLDDMRIYNVTLDATAIGNMFALGPE